ncbi:MULTISPECIES: putative holin [unclassified Polaromonas]|jgi:hypothetical protein|uniref:putative holin n=1 Tax=unclassified Polaromonas TaxID=2638319 RepID=UPI000BDBFFEC|nr:MULTISPECIES: putative holin [unclassified Polaromonas]OYZ76063.1 MAG: hypothetical protein B7Y09_21800 [Polaromonas sp. 24-63-21]OZA47350.1 MAG: hypothetical protein B7X88_22265 [Polaromonas sp. 17-63-33]
MFSKFPRMLVWLVLTIVLMILALVLQAEAPGNLVAVTLYKMHLLSLAGWGGYWLDRALFPYDRPHCYLEDDAPGALKPVQDGVEQTELDLQFVASRSMASAQLRRAIVVAACIVGVCLGA